MIPESLAPVANHLWQSTIFAGAAGLLTLALRKNAARVRHWVWVAASVKFLVPFSFLAAMGSAFEWKTAPVIAPQVSAAVQQVSEPFAIVMPSSPTVAAESHSSSSLLPEILFVMWACGFVGIAISWWVRWRHIARAVRTGTPMELGLPIRCVSSPSFLEPGIFGIFRPVLLLPNGIFEHLSPEQWRSIVAHELCHVRHRDNLIGAMQMFVETVFWFHPLVWWIGKRIFEERERACDEAVMRSGCEAKTYAEGILKVCGLYLEAPGRCMAGVGGANLRTRIESILSQRAGMELTGWKKLLIGGTGVLAVIMPFAAGVLAQDPQLQFEVASVRPSGPGTRRGPGLGFAQGGPGTADPEHLRYERVLFQQLLMDAYGVQRDQIQGPDWATTDAVSSGALFDVSANVPPGTTKQQAALMLQNLLKDRFKLALHHITVERAGFALIVAKGGPKLKESAGPVAQSERNATVSGAVKLQPEKDGFPELFPGSNMGGTFQNGTARVRFRDYPLSDLVRQTSFALAVRMIDKTGLSGKYDFTLEIVPPENAVMVGLSFTLPLAPGQASPLNAQGPNLGQENSVSIVSAAMEKQLGLKLESAKIPVDTLVIDRVERTPVEN